MTEPNGYTILYKREEDSLMLRLPDAELLQAITEGQLECYFKREYNFVPVLIRVYRNGIEVDTFIQGADGILRHTKTGMASPITYPSRCVSCTGRPAGAAIPSYQKDGIWYCRECNTKIVHNMGGIKDFSVQAAKTEAGGLKTYADKHDWDLLLQLPLEEMINCLADGNLKYERNNWKEQTGEVVREYRNASNRHLVKHARGEVFIPDPKGDIQVRHLAAAAVDAMIALYHELKNEKADEA